jgi:hypothetical protein
VVVGLFHRLLDFAKPAPKEMMRVETHYRFRGDGEIQQTVKQTYDHQARDEDEAWARGMFGEFLALDERTR